MNLRKKFPIFAALTKRRIKLSDLQSLAAVLPIVENRVHSRGETFFHALEYANDAHSTVHLAISMDLIPDISRVPRTITAPHDTKTTLTAIRALSRELRFTMRAMLRKKPTAQDKLEDIIL